MTAVLRAAEAVGLGGGTPALESVFRELREALPAQQVGASSFGLGVTPGFGLGVTPGMKHAFTMPIRSKKAAVPAFSEFEGDAAWSHIEQLVFEIQSGGVMPGHDYVLRSISAVTP